MLCSFDVSPRRGRRHHRFESEVRVQLTVHVARAQIACQKNHALFEVHDGVVAQPQHGLVQDAEQQPRHRWRRLFDFVEEHQRKVAGFARYAVHFLLREQGLCLAMAQIAGRRSQQFGHFVFHLEFAAIHSKNFLGAAVQHFRECFDGFGFSRSGGTQQQKHTGWPALGREHRAMHLNIGNDSLYGGRLADQSARQSLRNIAGEPFKRDPDLVEGRLLDGVSLTTYYERRTPRCRFRGLVPETDSRGYRRGE